MAVAMLSLFWTSCLVCSPWEARLELEFLSSPGERRVTASELSQTLQAGRAVVLTLGNTVPAPFIWGFSSKRW